MMANLHEIVRIPEGALAWVYLFSENNITSVSNHWHYSLELTMICDGQAHYTINGHELHPKKGELVLINSGDLHGCQIPQGQCEGISIMIPNRYLAQFNQDQDTVLFRLDSAAHEYRRILDYCEELYHVFSRRSTDPYAQLRINSLVSDVTYVLFSRFRWDDFSPHSIESQKYRKRCFEFAKYIDENFREDISMQHLMKEFCISKEHLARIFRDHMGTTFKQHLTRTRMYNAYKLLTGSDLTITQIAMDSGFSDSRAFIASFCKIYGATPGQYRHEFQNLQIGYQDAIRQPVLFPEEMNARKVFEEKKKD